MFKLLIISLYIIKIIFALNPILDLTDRDLQITNKIPCVQRISSKYFTSKYKLRGSLVIFNFPSNNIEYADVLLKKFHEDNPTSTLMSKNSARPHHDPRHVIEKAKNYFMIVNHSFEIVAIIKQLQALPTWNALAEVLVWFLTPQDEGVEHNEIDECFELLLNASLIHTHLIYSTTNSSKIIVLTWYPYGNGNCPSSIGPIEKVSECEFTHRQLVERDYVNSSETKIPTKLNNCTLKVSATNWIPFSAFRENGTAYGIEVLLIKLIARQIQLNPEFSDRNSNRANTKVSSSMYAELLEKKCHVMIGGLDENPITRKLLSSSISYFEDDITWCVRVAQPKPTYENIFVIFELSTWLLTFAIAVAAGIILCCFHKYDIIKKTQYDISWTLLLSYAVTLSCPVNYYPRITYLRLFFIALVLYGIHINIAYHSKLISFLTKPRFQTQVNSLSAAIDKSFVLAGGIANFEHFNTTTYVSNHGTSHLKVCTNIDACFGQLRRKENYAVAISRAHATNLNLTEKQYYCFPRINNIYPFSISMLFQRQHHLLAKFNDIIRSCMEAGLIDRWIERTTFRNKQKVNKTHDSEEYTVLTLDHVQGAFIVWAIGMVLSIIVFLVERFHLNCKSTKKTAKCA